MSVLALMTAVIAKKIGELAPRPVEVEITTLQASVDDLNSRLAQLEGDLSVVRLECDRWRTLAEGWQARWERVMDPGAAREREAQQLAQAQMNRLMAQAQQQHMQAAQQLAAQNFYQEGIPQMLGAQGLGQMNQAQALAQVMDDAFCNCVPARHDMFTGIFRRNS